MNGEKQGVRARKRYKNYHLCHKRFRAAARIHPQNPRMWVRTHLRRSCLINGIVQDGNEHIEQQEEADQSPRYV